MTSRKGVVTDVTHALRRKAFLIYLEHLRPNKIGHPGEEAVGYNVIEFPEPVAAEIQHVLAVERKILQAELGCGPAGLFNMTVRKRSEERRVGKECRSGWS